MSLTIREEFAKAAMQAILSNPKLGEGRLTCVQMIEDAAWFADALVAKLANTAQARENLLGTLDQINVAACYASEEDPGAAREALLHIGELARAAITLVQP